MRRLLSYLGITTFDRLGRCLFCIRAAFASAVCAGLLALCVSAAAPGRPLGFALAVVAAAFSLLWFAHVSSYAVRAARCRISTPTISANGVIIQRSRRDLFPIFAKAFAVLALASIVGVASRARAQGSCPSGVPYDCGANWCCAQPSLWHCSGYTGTVPNWVRMGSFCTNDNSDEAVADLRSNCAALEHC